MMKPYRETVTKRFEQSTSGFFTGMREFTKDLEVSAYYLDGSKYLTKTRLQDFKAVAARLYCTHVCHVVAHFEGLDNKPILIVEIQGWIDEEKQQTICVYLIFDAWGQCLAGADILIEDHKASGYVGIRDNGATGFFKHRINFYISRQISNRQVEIVDAPYIYSTRPPKEIVTIVDIPMKKLKDHYPKHYANLKRIKRDYEISGHHIMEFQKMRPNEFSPLQSIKREYVKSGNFNPIVWQGLINDDFYCIGKESGVKNYINYTLYKGIQRVMIITAEEEGDTVIVADFENISPFYLNQFMFNQIKKDFKEHGFKRIEILLPIFKAALVHRLKDHFSRRFITPDFLRFGIAV